MTSHETAVRQISIWLVSIATYLSVFGIAYNYALTRTWGMEDVFTAGIYAIFWPITGLFTIGIHHPFILSGTGLFLGIAGLLSVPIRQFLHDKREYKQLQKQKEEELLRNEGLI
jgi:hypothetical protein